MVACEAYVSRLAFNYQRPEEKVAYAVVTLFVTSNVSISQAYKGNEQHVGLQASMRFCNTSHLLYLLTIPLLI